MKEKESIPFLDWKVESTQDMPNVKNVDNEIVYIDSYEVPPMCYEPFKMDSVIINFIEKGRFSWEVDLKRYDCKAPCLLIELAGKTRKYQSDVKEIAYKSLLLSPSFSDELFAGNNQRELLIQEFSENPVVPLDKQQTKLCGEYFELIKNELQSDNPNRKEIVKHLLRALVSHHQGGEHTSTSKQMGRYGDFMKLLRENYKISREVSFYAKKMNISPRYLSRIVLEASKKTALEWINDLTINEIKAALRSERKTMKELAAEFHFKNGDIFTKYFTRLTQISPSEYRRKYGF
ncbi:MAG: helix-turn-helix domain-containing protein [Bacteroidales bacterium]|nr:helix-turn-helix domain-containing protein [Bacteroidales bacterium]